MIKMAEPMSRAILITMLGLGGPAARAADPELAAAGARLIAAYPGLLDRVDGGVLIWRDGTRMPLNAVVNAAVPGAGPAAPALADMLEAPYPAFMPLAAPPAGSDPGRVRNGAFLAHMYGECRKGEVEPRLTRIAWLPLKTHQSVRVTTVNGVADRLRTISAALDKLPAAFDIYLMPSAGGYNCRTVAGERAASAHAYGIAIDIALARADYWRWHGGRGSPGAVPAWRNRVPREIVEVFESAGFIWGGRWSHFDTMHFEYRPELFGAAAGSPVPH